MRFVVDENLPDALALWLAAKEHDVAHVYDWVGGGADDGRIWRRALSERRIIVTKDSDFLLRRSTASGPQILLLRVGNRGNADLLRDVELAWLAAEKELWSGQPVVVIERSKRDGG